MTRFTDGDPLDLQVNQYGTGDNLNARIRLHHEFSIDDRDWHVWVFDWMLETVGSTGDLSVLEVGCGTGELWLKNVDRIPPGWSVTLSDFSEGMVREAKAQLSATTASLHFATLDVSDDPIPGPHDLIIANHMLYHVPDRPSAIAKMAAALTPQGTLVCTTNAQGHMGQLDELLEACFPQVEPDQTAAKFGAETGFDLLRPHFDRVVYDGFGGGLDVTDPQAVMDYAMSTPYAVDFTPEQIDRFQQRLRAIFADGGSFVIDKAPIMFTCQRPR